MTDAFHLTPHDIRAQEFTVGLRGYDRGAVDAFREKVAEEVERLLRERAQFEERLRNFQEQLRAFRERERAMNDALLAAQQLRADVEQQASRQAESTLASARQEAARVLAEARTQEGVLRERAETARRQLAAYLAGVRTLLERQLAEFEGLEAQTRAAPPPVNTGGEG